MTIRKIILTFLSLVFSFIAHAGDLTYLRKIKWALPPADQKTSFIPTFFGASIIDSLPYYTDLFKLPKGTHIKLVEVVPVETQPFDLYQSPGTDKPQIQHSIYPVKKESYVRVSFCPVIYNSDMKRTELITTFLVTIKTEPVQKKKSLSNSWAGHSVLASGKWVRVSVPESGVYKIPYSDLQSWELENPAQPRIFGNGGRIIPEINNLPQPDDLKEIPVMLVKGEDDQFGAGDYLLFYAEGPVTWAYDSIRGMVVHQKHLYDDSVFYFITSGPTREIAKDPVPNGSVTYTTSKFDAADFRDEDVENLLKSGRQWYEPLAVGVPADFKFTFPGRSVTDSIRFSVRVAGRSGTGMQFPLSINSINAGSLSVSGVSLGSYTSDYARANSGTFSTVAAGSDITLSITPQSSDPVNSKSWLDYVDINTRSDLIFDGSPFVFRDLNSIAKGRISEFRIQSAIKNVHIWDITHLNNIREMEATNSGGVTSFRATTDTLRTFIIFSGDDFPGVTLSRKKVENQDLHGIGPKDYLIVTAPKFLNQAEELADIHRENDGLRVQVVTTEQVYNEFSSGSRDPGAIRNFVRMMYDRAIIQEDIPKYLLLFGDGSFDNRSNHPGNTNIIPTWQSENSLSPTRSFVSDDFFGLLDPDEGGAAGLVDIGIGRFPVNSGTEADIILGKIKKYLSPEARGNWRSNICFIGDDEDSNIHMRDANTLASYIENYYPAFNLDKIYLDAFEQVTTSSGDRYPDVNAAIEKRVQSGSLIVNYVGHGNERGLAHENILGVEDINRWQNLPRLPLFVTATCEFSRFDDVEREITGEIASKPSAGEWVLLNPNGGGIALLTTTRLVYSSPNFVLNQNFYKFIFKEDLNGSKYRIGDALRWTKNISGSGINKRNFTLLGDPALRLAYPEYKVVTDSINHVPAESATDTLKALGLVHISGHLEDLQGNVIMAESGIVNPRIYDKSREITTLANDGGTPMTFSVRDNILFNGTASIQQGVFSFSFRVPKDINYMPGSGKLSFYAEFDSTDAFGNFDQVIVGGYASNSLNDNEGPEIDLFINDTLFRTGGITGNDINLFAIIRDKNGINTTGNGIGHDLVAFLDGDFTNPMVLNNYFEYDLDSYQSGTVEYPLFNLSPGIHYLKIKAWDNLNNSGEAELTFEVVAEEGAEIRNVLNFPNPFSEGTWITFEHNLGSEDTHLEIRIYDFGGKLIRILRQEIPSTGFRLPPLYWDGKDEYGQNSPAGIYVFRVNLRSEDGTKNIYGVGKMVRIR